MYEALIGGVLFESDPSDVSRAYVIEPDGLTGWFDAVDVRGEAIARPAQHGDFDLPVFRAARMVTISGTVLASSEYELTKMGAVLTGLLADGESGALTVLGPDGSTTATVRLSGAPKFAPHPSGLEGDFQIGFKAVDPRKYGVQRQFRFGWQELARNLFTNPNLVGDGTWAEVYRNYLVQPNLSASTSGWSANSSMTLSSGSTGGVLVADSDIAAGTGILWASSSTRVAVTPGEVLSLAGAFTSSVPLDLALEVTWYTSGSITGSESVDFTSTSSHMVSKLEGVVVPAGIDSARYTLRAKQVIPAGAVIGIADGMSIEKSSKSKGLFSGASPAGSVDPDMRQSWVGAVNNSESVVEIERVAGVTGGCVSTVGGTPAIRVLDGKTATFPANSGDIFVATARGVQQVNGVTVHAGDVRLTASGAVVLGAGWWTRPARLTGGYDGPWRGGTSLAGLIPPERFRTKWAGVVDASELILEHIEADAAHHYGNFPASPVIEVVGPRTAPYTITGPGGRVVTVTQALTSGQTHRIDFATGAITRNGVRQKSAISHFQPWTIPAGSEVPMSISAGTMTVTVADTYM